MKKIVSYCLWGSDPTYTIGAIKNAKLMVHFYPGWIARFYIANQCVPTHIIETLQSTPFTEVILRESKGDNSSMMWRFEPIDEKDVSVMIVRDTDSRLTRREVYAVNDWLDGNRGFHIMRDHPYHQTEVMGGMWGVKQNVLPFKIRDSIDTFMQPEAPSPAKGLDQEYLRKVMWPYMKENACIHDPFFEKKPFPTPRYMFETDQSVFVGECVRYDDSVWSENDRKVLMEAENYATK